MRDYFEIGGGNIKLLLCTGACRCAASYVSTQGKPQYPCFFISSLIHSQRGLILLHMAANVEHFSITCMCMFSPIVKETGVCYNGVITHLEFFDVGGGDFDFFAETGGGQGENRTNIREGS